LGKCKTMKAGKKQKKILPEVHILGDLKDAAKFVSIICKKKRVIIFQDGEKGTFHAIVKGKASQIQPKEITKLEKDYKLVYISFFPRSKKNEAVTEVAPDRTQMLTSEKKTGKKEKVTDGINVNKEPKIKIVAKRRLPVKPKVKNPPKKK
jgi:hypothetical protein